MRHCPSDCSIDDQSRFTCRCTDFYDSRPVCFFAAVKKNEPVINHVSSYQPNNYCLHVCRPEELTTVSQSLATIVYLEGNCTDNNFNLAGDFCSFPCALTGPVLQPSIVMVCSPNGSWVMPRLQTPCAIPLLTGAPFLFVPRLSTWPVANILARSYMYRGIVGQLLAPTSAAQNYFGRLAGQNVQQNLVPTFPFWIAAAADEYSATENMTYEWSAFPVFKKRLYPLVGVHDATAENWDLLNLFQAGYPNPLRSGGLMMTDAGTW
jgi:hypothetical protein